MLPVPNLQGPYLIEHAAYITNRQNAPESDVSPQTLDLQTPHYKATVTIFVSRQLRQKQLWSSGLRMDTISIQGPKVNIEALVTRLDMATSDAICDGDQVLRWVHKHIKHICLGD